MRRIGATGLGTAILLWSLAFPAAAVAPGFAPGRTTRASVNAAGDVANGAVLVQGVLSANGRYAVFVSNATNLVSGVGSVSVLHVYRHDRVSGATDLVSVNKSGQASVAGGFAPSVSADGRYVVFASSGADIVDGDTNNAIDVFVRDMQTGTTVAASADPSGALTSAGGSLSAAAGAREISDDGRYVVFISRSTNLVPDPNNDRGQIYVKDLRSGRVVRASVDGSGAPGNDNSSAPTISGNGGVVGFASTATNLPSAATNHIAQMFVRDLVAGTTRLESVKTDGTPDTSWPSTNPALSYDGRYVAFESMARLDTRDRDTGTWDVYLRDRVGMTTVLASLSASTIFGLQSRGPVVSEDGRYVGFHSPDATLVAGDANAAMDVFLYDRTTDALTLVSLNDDGQQANMASSSPSVSADGMLVLFMSAASNLVATPRSTTTQLYVRDLVANKPPVVTAGGDAALDEGVDLVRAGSFTDDDASTSWTGTVDYGDGAGTLPLALAADKTFTLTRSLAPGAYAVTVSVRDDAGAVGVASFHVTVTNIAPTVEAGAAVELAFDPTLRRGGSFTDPGTTETYSATVDYGDGSGAAALALDGRAFTLEHAYAAAGSYTVDVRVTDSNGGTGATTLGVLVRRYSYEWLAPLATDDPNLHAGRTVPLRFAVRRPDGTFVLDKSVNVTLLDASGAVVVGPYVYGKSPSRDVTDNGSEYHVNLDTGGLDAGAYAVRVRFASPALTGEFARDLTLR